MEKSGAAVWMPTANEQPQGEDMVAHSAPWQEGKAESWERAGGVCGRDDGCILVARTARVGPA